MTRAFLFYWARSTRNAVATQLRRLRRPKYLVPALGGFAFLAMQWGLILSSSSGRRKEPVPLSPEMLSLAETGLALLLLVGILWPWLRRAEGTLAFKEADIQMLFPAPVSRRALLNLRLARLVLPILLSALLYAFFFLGRIVAAPDLHAMFVAAGWFVTLAFMALHGTGVSLAKTALREQGVSGLKRQAWAVVAIGCVVGTVAVWLRWYVPPPPWTDWSLDAAAAWVARATDAGPLAYLLYPLRLLLRPAFAADLGSFALRLLPALAMLGLAYAWVVRIDAGFEEGAVEAAKKWAAWQAEPGLSLGRTRARRVRRAAFRLAPEGSAFVAFAWKNLTTARRRTNPALAFFVVCAVLVPLLVIAISGGPGVRRALPLLCATIAAWFAITTTLSGQSGLSDDLLRLDAVKTYPAPGRALVLGGVVGRTASACPKQWLLIAVAAGSLAYADHRVLAVLPSLPVLALSAAVLLPCISFLLSAVWTAPPLFWPGWLLAPFAGDGNPARAQQRMAGLQVLMMIAALFVLQIAALPALLAGGAVALVGYPVVGWAILPFAALAAGAVLVAEGWLLVAKLGRLVDRFDVALEFEGVPTGP